MKCIRCGDELSAYSDLDEMREALYCCNMCHGPMCAACSLFETCEQCRDREEGDA